MKQYVVDAFTDTIFRGNPAAICVIERWLPDSLMHNIAVENNLSETAFAVPTGDGTYRLRWFTPGGEVELCGHATLDSAYVITQLVEPGRSVVPFDTLSGRLVVERQGDLLTMDLPSFELKPVPITDQMVQALGVRPVEAYLGADLVCVLESEGQVRQVTPSQEIIQQMDGLCLHITAHGDNDSDYDCVTRTFAPKCGVAEDPVCGRGHCHVIPLWAKRLGKSELLAYQASSRGGELRCHQEQGRTFLGGAAVLYAESEIHV